ncbi:MAG: NifB/NifX family molybdenum-iron cluster-binding protein [Candidatus Bipolaricaulota bacterium]
MRLCIPTSGGGGLDDRVGEHFGRVPTYTIYDTDTQKVEVLPNQSEHMGGAGLPAEHLAAAGVDVVLCAGLGRRAIALLSESGIEVCSGASGTVREALQAWQEGHLSEAEPCTQHAFHDRHG